MVYGSQQWPTIMRMDADEIATAYHCIAIVKIEEGKAAKKAAEEAKARGDA